jgi:O-acetyl-ADP-ribose deacetylase (regulator of RNase III)
MAIGIGLHCWYCDHGPCNGQCREEDTPKNDIMSKHSNFGYVDGDLIKLALSGKFDVIAHGCNCLSNMGAGLAPHMARTFGCDKFPMETRGADINKLGCIDYRSFVISKTGIWDSNLDENINNDPVLTVVNAYTQFRYGRNHSDGDKNPLDYEALTLCMRKMNNRFNGKHIGLPKIGAGLAGGDWDKIEAIIKKELKDCQVTIVNFKK